MVIDLILNRKDGTQYSAKTFYNNVVAYGEIGFDIAEALDNGEEEDIKKALAKYIKENEYNPKIIEYIDSVKWL